MTNTWGCNLAVIVFLLYVTNVFPQNFQDTEGGLGEHAPKLPVLQFANFDQLTPEDRVLRCRFQAHFKGILPTCGDGNLFKTIRRDGSEDQKLKDCCQVMLDKLEHECLCALPEAERTSAASVVALAIRTDDYLKQAQFADSPCATIRKLNCTKQVNDFAASLGICHMRARKAVDECKPLQKILKRGGTSFFGLQAVEDPGLAACCSGLKPLSKDKCFCKLTRKNERTNHATKDFVFNFVEKNREKLTCNDFTLSNIGCEFWNGVVKPLPVGTPFRQKCNIDGSICKAAR